MGARNLPFRLPYHLAANELKRNVRYWHVADRTRCPTNVRYRSQSEHGPNGSGCPLMIKADERI
jgi:hypothetical protein